MKATGRLCQVFEAFLKNVNFQKGFQLIVKGLSEEPKSAFSAGALEHLCIKERKK